MPLTRTCTGKMLQLHFFFCIILCPVLHSDSRTDTCLLLVATFHIQIASLKKENTFQKSTKQKWKSWGREREIGLYLQMSKSINKQVEMQSSLKGLFEICAYSSNNNCFHNLQSFSFIWRTLNMRERIELLRLSLSDRDTWGKRKHNTWLHFVLKK